MPKKQKPVKEALDHSRLPGQLTIKLREEEKKILWPAVKHLFLEEDGTEKTWYRRELGPALKRLILNHAKKGQIEISYRGYIPRD